MGIKPFIMALTVSLNLLDFETGSYSNMAQNPIILDMDFCTDVDDAVAVRMATTLDDMDVCTLMAVGLCTTASDGSDINVRALHGLLTDDGYRSVPIGTAHVTEPDVSPYWEVCSQYSVMSPETKDAVELYKDILRSSYNKVTIVTTGYLTNIQYLLQDTEGYGLVRDKCSQLVVTGGTFPSGKDNNFSYTPNAATAVKYVEENCPVRIVYVPNDVGGQFTAGGLIQDLGPNDVLSKALSAFGTQDGRAAWDPTAVFIAAVPQDVSNFSYVPIEAEFGADGSHTFNEKVSTTNSSNNNVVTEDRSSVDGKNMTNSTNSDNSVNVSGYSSDIGAVESSDNTSPSDMFETPIKEKESEAQRSYTDSTVTIPTDMRVAVRYKSGISAKQYQDMIEGIISYEYLR